jgi:hypothetical protein
MVGIAMSARRMIRSIGDTGRHDSQVQTRFPIMVSLRAI